MGEKFTDLIAAITVHCLLLLFVVSCATRQATNEQHHARSVEKRQWQVQQFEAIGEPPTSSQCCSVPPQEGVGA